MTTITIYHNPRCSKSRATLSLLDEKGHTPNVVEYLKNPLDKAELKDLAKKLGVSPGEMVREKEVEWQQLGIDKSDGDKVLEAIAKEPKLLERPIVVCGNKAAIGRPPEQVLAILP